MDVLHAAQLLAAAQSAWQPEWTVAVELCVHVQARAYGFQVVNAAQEATQKGQCAPATSGAAADHLIHLLKDRAAVVAAEEAPAGQPQPARDADHVLKESIASLHAAYFAQGPYQSWKAKSNVRLLDRELSRFVKSRSLVVGRSVAAANGRADGSNVAGFTGVSDAPEWVLQLAQLGLYFLLWTEAANLRHTPELMWLLYHIMLSSSNFNKACAVLGSTDLSHYSLLRWLPSKAANGMRSSVGAAAPPATNPPQPSVDLGQLSCEEVLALADDALSYERARQLGFMRGVLLPVRNALGNAARVGALLEEGPGPHNTGMAQANGSHLHEAYWWSDFPDNELAARQVSGLAVIKSQPGVGSGTLGTPAGCWSLAQLVAEDLAFYGDGCIVLDMVIQPVFNLMAEQVCLMGDSGEAPALRLGYDDFNESACMPQVLSALVLDLSGEHFVDPWDGVLKRFITSAAAVEAVCTQSSYADCTLKPATSDMQQRYPRDPRRLEELAAKLRDAGAGGVKGAAALRRRWEQQQERLRQEGQAAEGEGDWVAPSTNGSMPVVHLLASLRATDSLWAKLFKKSFVETRSIGTVAVAFSRVYIVHAILLCWMSLLAYRVPDLSLSGANSIFTGRFWQANGLTFANCISWGVFLHAALHVVKDLLILQLLATPSAVRYQLDTSERASTRRPPAGLLARLRLRSAWRSHYRQYGQDDRLEQIVQPPVHGGGLLKLHNIATLLFWLACCVILLDSHIPSWPLNKLLTQALTQPGRAGPSMPVWGLMSLVYVGLWVLHWLSGALADSLPSSLSSVTGMARKDSRRAAEHFFPYGAMSGSQNWRRFLVNTLLWVLVLLVKVLFDFFVVLQPLGTGPVRKLLLPLDSATPWTRWAEAVLAVWSLWVAAAFLVFYNTGLFWQLISALYSTLFLGMRRRIGHVKTWYDLVWAFPRLSYKFTQRMIPTQAQLARTWGSSGGGAAPGKDAAVLPVGDAGAGNGAVTAAGGAAAAAAVGVAAPAVEALHLVPLNSRSETVFYQAWNQIVDDLRSRDLLSNAEAGSLKYVQLGWGTGRETAWLLLPKFVTAGAAVEAVGQRALTSKTQIDVIARCFNWLVWLLAALNMLQEAEVQALLLAPSSAEAGPRGSPGPREASTDDLLDAAAVLIKSRELLEVLGGKLGAAAVPFCPLGSKEDPAKPDVNTQMLLAETLGAVAALARPKLPKDAVAAIKARPHQLELATDVKADPCADLAELRREEQQAALGAAQAAAEGVKAAEGQGPEALAAARGALADAQAQVQAVVLDPRKRRRQLYQQVVSWLLDMLKHTRGEAVPKSGEAVRALTFFATSLSNPKIPTAQPVALTRSMTTLTPHYGEGVIYALSEAAANGEMCTRCGSDGDDLVLLNEQEEPTETLNYLRIVYAREWANFQERLVSRADVRGALEQHSSSMDAPTAADIREAAFLPGQPLHKWCHELLAWASMRGQLLQRTVHGMMYYETALQQLILMQCRPQLTRMARRIMEAGDAGSLRKQHLPDGWADQVAEAAALLLAREKYSYVVSSQVLGEMQLGGRVMQRWLAHSIRSVLSKKYPSLRIAYIDLENLGELPPADTAAAAAAAAAAAQGPGQRLVAGARNRGRGGKAHRLLRQYSVLLQHDEAAGGVVEVYRVRLPINLETDRGVILGEGKPENQNHAIIFCHTEAVQTIDCNQDNFFVEALKLPNLLAEFELQQGGVRINVRGSLSQQQQDRGGFWAKLTGAGSAQGPALLGFREWIFSEDSGALAEFAAATERSFGTTMQRVMSNPGGCRFHYGHPDVWDKLFTMTNGGVSKATKSLHVSEDVFGGYNVMLRGRDISYVDYIAVGKGRDMGFETINTFEAKIAAGNGEQVVSRDVSRLARRMNMPRLLSWYFTGNGFFINTALLMYSMLVNAWLCLLLVLLSGVTSTGTVLDDSLAVVGGLQVLQLGSLSVLVYVATVWLEDGFFTTIKNVLKQFVAGSLFFYVFRGQTSAAAFNSDLAYGGATYAATGRGYKLRATPFLEVFMRYGRTHMWFGVHLLVLLLLAVSLGLKASLLVAWANILAILSLLAAPFWFNPFSLDWQTNKEAAREWLDWMAGHKPASSGSGGKKLWRQYNEEQLQKAADDSQRQLGRTGRNLFGVLFMSPSLVIMCVAVYGMLDAWWGGIIVVSAVNGLLGLLTACWQMATHLEAVKNAAVVSRSVKFVLKTLLATAAILVFALMVDPATRRKINLFRVVVRVLLVEFELARLSGRLLIAFLPRWQPARRLVDSMCWVADFAVGALLLLLLFVGSLFGLLTRYQAAVLFSMGYAAYYLAETNLKHSEVGRLAKELKDLQRQERALERPGATTASQPQQQQQQHTGSRPSSGHTSSLAPQQPWAAGLFSAQQQQQHGGLSTVGSSWATTADTDAQPPPPPAVAAAGGGEAAVRWGSSPGGVVARGPPSEDLLRSWKVEPPSSRSGLQQQQQVDPLARALQRCDTSWSRGEYVAGPELCEGELGQDEGCSTLRAAGSELQHAGGGQGPAGEQGEGEEEEEEFGGDGGSYLTPDIVREASEAGAAAAAAAARTASSGSAGAPGLRSGSSGLQPGHEEE